MRQLIAYFRVSTKGQQASGLGLAAQREAVAAYAKATGATIVGEYTERESGKRADRPKLAAALSHARGAKATLCVAKMDRLSRNVAFLAALMDAGAEFVACDNPTANKLTIHVLAAVAQYEAEAISQRTKDALAQAKANGTKLGSARRGHWQGREHLRLAGAVNGQPRAVKAASAARSRATADRYGHLLESTREQRAAGNSLATIAERLNAAGHTTTRGMDFTAVAVMRLLRRV